jgi:hypothetical protein
MASMKFLSSWLHNFLSVYLCCVSLYYWNIYYIIMDRQYSPGWATFLQRYCSCVTFILILNLPQKLIFTTEMIRMWSYCSQRHHKTHDRDAIWLFSRKLFYHLIGGRMISYLASSKNQVSVWLSYSKTTWWPWGESAIVSSTSWKTEWRPDPTSYMVPKSEVLTMKTGSLYFEGTWGLWFPFYWNLKSSYWYS